MANATNISTPAPERSAVRRRRRRIALLVYLAFLAGASLLLAEVMLRVMGHRPFKPESPGITVKPGGKLYQKDPVLGYKHLPGTFAVTLADGYTFTVTHLTNTLRATAPAAPTPQAGAPGLWIFGGSFVHGWSLNDPETMPWRVQAALPRYEVANFGVGGYGNLHGLLQYRERRARGDKPALVVACYAYFHDERNTLLRVRRKAIVPYNQLGLLEFPYARLAPDGKLDLRREPVTYWEWPGQRASALIHFLEEQANVLEHRLVKPQRVSLAIFQQLGAECQRDGVSLVVAALTRGVESQRLLQACRASGLRAVDVSASLSEPGSRNLPHDDHPSARTQARYADKLVEYLMREHLAP